MPAAGLSHAAFPHSFVFTCDEGKADLLAQEHGNLQPTHPWPTPARVHCYSACQTGQAEHVFEEQANEGCVEELARQFHGLDDMALEAPFLAGLHSDALPRSARPLRPDACPSIRMSSLSGGFPVKTTHGVKELRIGETAFVHGETCLFGEGVTPPAPLANVFEEALRSQTSQYHKKRAPSTSALRGPQIQLCGRCLGVLPSTGPTCSCKFKWSDLEAAGAAARVYHAPASQRTGDHEVSVYRVGMEGACDASHRLAMAAIYVMGWLLGLEGGSFLDEFEDMGHPRTILCPVFILTTGTEGSPTAVWAMPDQLPRKHSGSAPMKPGSFLEAVAVIQRPAGMEGIGASLVDFIRGCARHMGFFHAGPAYPSTVFFPPGWALLMSSLREHLCGLSGELHDLTNATNAQMSKLLLAAYRTLGMRNSEVVKEVPLLLLRFGFFDTLLRWPPKSKPSTCILDITKFKEGMFPAPGGAKFDDADEGDDDEPDLFDGLLAAAASEGAAISSAALWEARLRSKSACGGAPWSAHTECAHKDAKRGLMSLVAAFQFKAADLCGILLGLPAPSQMQISAPEFFQVVKAAGLPALKGTLRDAIAKLRCQDPGGAFCDPVGSAVLMAQIFHLHEIVQYITLAAVHTLTDVAFSSCKDALEILCEALSFSAYEVLPAVLDELAPWRATIRYWANLRLGLGGRLPCDRAVLAMMRKAQMYSTIWGGALLVKEAIFPHLREQDIPDDLHKFMAALDGWFPDGPAGSLPGEHVPVRLGRILSRLHG